MWGIPAAVFFVAFLHRVVPGVIAKDVMEAFGATALARKRRQLATNPLGQPLASLLLVQVKGLLQLVRGLLAALGKA